MGTKLEEDRIILHDLRNANLKVDFFLGNREDLHNKNCISYSTCWKKVDVRVDLVTFTEQISELTFFFSIQQLFIDDCLISGEVIDFHCENNKLGLLASCKILIGRDY